MLPALHLLFCPCGVLTRTHDRGVDEMVGPIQSSVPIAQLL